MKGLVIYIRREKLDAVCAVLRRHNAAGFSVSNVEGCGRRKRQIDIEDVAAIPALEPEHLAAKLRVYTVVPDTVVDTLVDEICTAAATDRFGDGKIFIVPVEDAIRIRTRERGETAL